jgi:hypothetical protein
MRPIHSENEHANVTPEQTSGQPNAGEVTAVQRARYEAAKVTRDANRTQRRGGLGAGGVALLPSSGHA